MNAKDTIRNAIEFSYLVVNSYTDDLTDAELLVRSVPGANHIAWQLGHLISGTSYMLAELGQPATELPAGFAEKYTTETAASDESQAIRGQSPVPRPGREDESRLAGSRGCHAGRRAGSARSGIDAGVCADGRLGAHGPGHALDDARRAVCSRPPQTGQAAAVLIPRKAQRRKGKRKERWHDRE